jgi:microcystin synthetase protein McyE
LQNNQNVDLALGGITVNSLDQDIVTAKFDLEFIFVEESELYLKLIYNTDIFAEQRISLLLKLLERLLEEIVEYPEIPLLKLSFHTENSSKEDSNLFATNFNF